MIQILIGSLLLSIVHALIPNHWIPLIAIGKTENWTPRETVTATIITGFAHTLSTVLVGIIIGFAGFKLAGYYEKITTLVAPLVLITIGLIYVVLDFLRGHRHEHAIAGAVPPVKNNKSRVAIIVSLSIAMFFSPCLELEAFFFSAGTLGWPGITMVSVVYTVTTVTVMAALVYLGIKGTSKFNWHFLEHHEKGVTGIILTILGILAFFVEF
ncbi:MAG: hypothetical protein JXB00_20055 [Bacteroidales bacterium]|nr:hypothetical protein [Bacteroidales bacterium]